jgi:hypothetical protein
LAQPPTNPTASSTSRWLVDEYQSCSTRYSHRLRGDLCDVYCRVDHFVNCRQNEGWVLSIGVCGASAAIILIVVSLVTATKRIPEFSDVQAEAIEQRVAQLVAAGVDESELRELVRSSIQLGRGL